ncbi:hypothetical protein [Tenacibaculum jejuense]|uniref:Macroglobulin domain-containing protein n=1 Tax=Tenacibaculum jejuense TaxID=584609 RepID=A0A238UEB1_9FLAO|nr:hypothetical protein [Tenacibaculum jejuense]SNR17432.1 protein of unknown function [Tenacibaculum jejuense]
MKKYITFLYLFFSVLYINSQHVAKPIPLESLYIQTNKDIFTSGEEIKFKVTILNSRTLKPSYASEILYLQILDIHKNVKFSHKFPIDRGVCKGRYKLSDVMKNGLYFLNVFTVNSINENFNIRAQKPFYIEQNFHKRLHITYNLERDSISSQLFASFKVNDRKYAPYKNVKTQLVYKTKSGRSRKQKIKTNDKGIVTFKLKDISKIDFSRIVFTVFDDAGKREEVINLIPPKFKNHFNVRFFPEGGHLFSGIKQRVGIKVFNEWNESIQGKIFLYEDDQKIQELKLEGGVTSVTHHFKNEKKYSIKTNINTKEFSVSFPEFKKSGVYLKVTDKGKTLKVDLNPVNFKSTKTFTLKAYYNGKEIHNEFISSLQSLVSFPVHVQDLNMGIVYLDLLDTNQTVLASRAVFVNQHKKLRVKPLKSIRKKYQPKEKVKLKFKILDDQNQIKRAVASVRISNEKSIFNEEGINLSSYYHLIKNSKERIPSSKRYFIKSYSKSLDHLMLNNYFKKNDSNYKRQSKLYSEDIIGKLYGRGLLNNLVVEKNKMIPVLGGKKVNSVAVDSLGNFKITPSQLQEMDNENLTLAYGNNETHLFTNFDFLIQSEEILKKPNINITNNIDFLSRKKISKKYLEDFSFDYLNSLDEVVVTKKVRKPKPFGVSKLYKGSVFDYVCIEYNILNCTNHKFGGIKPIDGQEYFINGGERVVYKKPESKIKKEKSVVSNMLHLKGFYDYPKKEKIENFYDLRTNLYWNPYLLNQQNGEFEIEFTTSEVRGLYQASIEVNSQDGLLGTYYFSFEVK